MSAERYLIVNADDFGQSAGVTRGIIKAHECGIVTSASLMVRGSAARDAARYARTQPSLSVGLHLDLCEWAFRDGEWFPLYEVVPTEDASAVADEVRRQLEMFRELMGCKPTHLDSHQHVHRAEPVRSIMVDAARELGVPLRDFDREIKYCGRFYGQAGTGEPLQQFIRVEGLLNILKELEPGITELGCHPGLNDDLVTMYRAERETEVETLCDTRVRAALAAEGIELCSFHQLPDRTYTAGY